MSNPRPMMATMATSTPSALVPLIAPAMCRGADGVDVVDVAQVANV